MEYVLIPQTFIKHHLCAGHCARASKFKGGYDRTVLALKGVDELLMANVYLGTVLCICLITGVLGTGKSTQW